MFKNRLIKNKNCLWRPCLSTDENGMNNSHRKHSIDAFYHVSVHLAKLFQRRRFFRNQPIRNKNCLWQPCLLKDQDEINNLYRGPYIDASYMYQVSVHLAQGFQRRRLKCEKLTDGRWRRTTSDGNSSRCLWQGEPIKKESLNSDNQQFHQYQLYEQSPLTKTHWT